ncbi:hypothetical protein GCM10008995_00360 [Halobellus salinus]|uniref:CARDB domain-containing protein n=1 Tax=Halobellus salinus TaxID=931585 RepID=A0A830E6H2_9EURY|nr:DUF1102 domain-containing protein [Halobellus salinus]GGI94100.1 hypothetical protein GCM10008995_00360 [Halobellus salinus]SMP19508.1 CARDB protein [Halobellus salinus]
MLSRRRTVILAVALVAAGSLVFTTGAAVLDDPADTVAEDRLTVQPAEGPNGKYAYLNDAEEVVIDISPTNPKLSAEFEGVTPDTFASADGVFTITYTADEYARVWIEHGGENVTFVPDSDSVKGTVDSTLEGEPNNVTLGPNETVTVGLRIDARGEVAGTQLGANEFSIRAEVVDPEDVSVSSGGDGDGNSPSVSVMSPATNEREFVATDTRPGGDVTFDAGGMEMDGGNVTVDRIELAGVPGGDLELDVTGSPDAFDEAGALDAARRPRSLAYLSLQHSFDAEGADGTTLRFSADPAYLDRAGVAPEHVALYRRTDTGGWERLPTDPLDGPAARQRGLPDDRVHFRARTDDLSTFAVGERVPRLDVTDTATDASVVAPGESVTVRTTVTNGGGVAGERTVTLTANGETVAAERVTLDPGASTTVELTGQVATAGEVTLSVDDAEVETLLVEQPDAGTDPAAERPEGAATPEDTGSDSPVLEPSGVDIDGLAGLALLVGIVTAAVPLVRRISRQ